VTRVRSRPGSYALVSANGGMLSKTSVGVYGATPTPRRADGSLRLQRELDAGTAPAVAESPTGWATIETYTVTYGRKGPIGIVIGRLESDGSRFVARAHDGDNELLALLQTGHQPVGQRVYVTAASDGNRVGMSRGHTAQYVSRPHVDVGPTR
jgi:acetyl-CoA C-acetyltransferase